MTGLKKHKEFFRSLMENKIYVGNFSRQVTSRALRGLFSRHGKVISVELIRDPQTKQSKGFAFIEMRDAGDASRAVRVCEGYTLGQDVLKVCQVQHIEKYQSKRRQVRLLTPVKSPV